MIGFRRAFLIAFALFWPVFAGERAQSKETPTVWLRASMAQAPLVFCSPIAVSLSISGGSFPEDKTDLQLPARFCRATIDSFKEERFEKLDEIAEQARTGKSRFAGGGWKLYSFYGLITNGSSSPSEAEWKALFAKLNRWLAVRPKSVAARIALATLYEKYAYAQSVSSPGDDPERLKTLQAAMQKTFQDRLKTARNLLDEAAALNAKDPQIYLVMMRVAISQGWEKRDVDELFERAVAVEPGYYYYYMERAVALIGETGGPVSFAAGIADRIGGPDGDIAYFHIARELSNHESEFLNGMSWPRIQRGFQSTEAEYGTSLMKLNWLCQIALYKEEPLEAAKLFDRIGKKWDESTWGNWYDFEAMSGIAHSLRELNSPEGSGKNLFKGYNDSIADIVLQKYSNTVTQCMAQGHGFVPASNLYVEIGPNGSVTDTAIFHDWAISHCLVTALESVQFPAPPEVLIGQDKTAVWVRIPLSSTQPRRLSPPTPASGR